MSNVPSLFLVRGLPGSGKSSLARLLPVSKVISADDYFTDDYGNYDFDPTVLPKAHAYSQDAAGHSLRQGLSVAVANTFSQRWEMQPYIEIGWEHHIHLVVIDLFDGGLDDYELFKRNVHGVPIGAIAKMRGRWEHSWRTGQRTKPERR